MPFNKFKYYQHNWLLVSCLLIFILAIFCVLYFNSIEMMNSRSIVSETLEFTLLSVIFIVPIIEEFTFRGIFLKNRVLFLTSVILLISFFLFFIENIYLLGILVVFITLFFVYRNNNSPFLFKIICCLNALIFSLAHYILSDFSSIEQSCTMLFQLSLGFFLIWITVNFSLMRSVLFHASYNTFLMTIVVLTVQFPDTTMQRYENASIIVEWQKVPYFNSNVSSYTCTDELIDAVNSSISNLYKVCDLRNSDKKNQNVSDLEPFMRYNIEITLKKNAIDKNIKNASNDFFVNKQLVAVDVSVAE